MDNGLLTVVAVLVGLVAGIGIIGLSLVVFIYFKYRPGFKALGMMLGSLAYVVSPIDVVPEVPLGPVGLVDDIGIIMAAVVIVSRAISARRARASRGLTM